MTAVDLSSDAGLIAMALLTINILLGLLLSVRYNPLRQWPHRRLPIFAVHNWTAYIALSLIVLHPVILLWSGTAGFHVLDVLWPMSSPHQRLYNILGAIAFYCVAFVVITSYFRARLGSRRWRAFHYVAYGAAAVLFVHALLIDPNLKEAPPDLLDGEKVLVEGCFLAVLAASIWRLRYALKRPAKRRLVMKPGFAADPRELV